MGKKDRKMKQEKKYKKEKRQNDKFRQKIVQREQEKLVEPPQEQQKCDKFEKLSQQQVSSESYMPVCVSTEQQCDEYMEDQSQQMSTIEYVNYVPLNSQSVYQEPIDSHILYISDFAYKPSQKEKSSVPQQTEFDDGEVLIQPNSNDFVQQTEQSSTEQKQTEKKKKHSLKQLLKKMKKHQHKQKHQS